MFALCGKINRGTLRDLTVKILTAQPNGVLNGYCTMLIVMSVPCGDVCNNDNLLLLQRSRVSKVDVSVLKKCNES